MKAVCTLLATLPVAAFAGLSISPDSIGLYDTGLGALNAADSYWDASGTGITGTADAYRIAPHNNWDNTPPAGWIFATPRPSGSTAAPIGNWVFELTFDLGSYDPNKVIISGEWGTDNFGEISLKDGAISGTNLAIAAGNGFSSPLTQFTIDGGLKSGLNTLLIDLENVTLSNGDIGTWSNNPAGLKVHFSDVQVIPEPSALLGAITASALGLLLLRRRRR